MDKLPNIDPEFIVVLSSCWTNEGGFGFNYSFDGERFNNRNDAIKHGWKLRSSDDFNIGQTYGDDLIWFGWMDQNGGEDEETMHEIASQIGLQFDRKYLNYKFSKATGKVVGFINPQETDQ